MSCEHGCYFEHKTTDDRQTGALCRSRRKETGNWGSSSVWRDDGRQFSKSDKHIRPQIQSLWTSSRINVGKSFLGTSLKNCLRLVPFASGFPVMEWTASVCTEMGESVEKKILKVVRRYCLQRNNKLIFWTKQGHSRIIFCSTYN